MKTTSPCATSIEMPRNTSMRREPIRKDWNKSRAINCVSTGTYLPLRSTSCKIEFSPLALTPALYKKNRRGKLRGDFSECKSWLHHSKRFQGRLVHRPCWFEPLRGLIFGQGSTRLWTKNTVHLALIKALLL